MLEPDRRLQRQQRTLPDVHERPYVYPIALEECTSCMEAIMVFLYLDTACRKSRRPGPAPQPSSGLLHMPFPLIAPHLGSPLVCLATTLAATSPSRPQPIPLTCFPNRSNSVFPVLSKYRIFLRSSTSLCCSNSSLAYCFISALVGGGILWHARMMVR